MKIVIVGGHFSPALAVIEKLKNEEVYYFGRKHVFEGDKALSLEYTEIEKLKIPFYAINTGRLQRKFTRHTISSLLKFPGGFIQTFRTLKKIEPDVVLGFGGYLFLPVAVSAWILKIPIVIHEQTLGAGFTNKIVSKLAKRICISWKSSEEFFPSSKIVLTGNPVKQEIIDVGKAAKKENEIPVIYITGGSGGAHAINLLVEQTLNRLLQKYNILHQTGDSQVYKDYERLEKLKNKHYECRKFLTPKESAFVMESADLVVGRAGINTVTELIYLQKAAFLIPIPVGQKNEQLKNAEYFTSLGLGDYIEQSALTPDIFVSKIDSMLGKIHKFRLNEEVKLGSATEKIIEVLRDVTQKKA